MRAAARLAVFFLCALAPITAFADSCVWFADDDSIRRVDTDTNQINLTIRLRDPSRLVMNAGDCGVWAVFKHDRRLLRFDASGAVLLELRAGQIEPRLDEIESLQVDPFDDSLWLSDGRRLVHLSSSGQLLRTVSTPGAIRGARIVLDQSLWLLGQRDLWHLDSQGNLLAAYTLGRHLTSNARFFALDNVRGVIWLASDDELSQLRLSEPTAPPFRFRLGDRLTGFALDPLSGNVWISLPQELRAYLGDGTLLRSVDLRPLDIRKPEKLAFDPAGRSLWAGAERSVARFTEDGAFVTRFPARDADEAFGVPAFKAEPALALVRPPQNIITNNPRPAFTLSYDALCNDSSCGFNGTYLGQYSLSAMLNNQAVGQLFAFDVNTGQASFTPALRLPEGSNSFSAQVRDAFGHGSNTVASNFTVDTVAPKFLTLTPPDGSTLASANVSIQGTTDDPSATVALSGGGVSQGGTSFGFPVVLRPGLNTYNLSATDRAGNVATTNLRLTLASISVAITSPANGATIQGDTVTVSGPLQGPPNTGVVVNGIVAVVTGNGFIATGIPLQTGANTVTVTATVPNGQTATQSVFVTSTAPPPVRVTTTATQGLAPLTVTFTLDNRSGSALQSFRMDFTGTGDYFELGDLTSVTRIYPAGAYQVGFLFFDRAGASYSQTVTVVAEDPAQVDQTLRATWNGFTSALASQDTARALQYFNGQGQARYGPVLNTLQPSLTQIAASLSQQQLMSVSGGIGEYVITRTVDGVSYAFLVYFLQGVDGVWRLDSM